MDTSKAQVALVHDHYDPLHLEAVQAEMLILGSPTIKAVWIEALGIWQALEGCHRLRAAALLGVPVTLWAVDYSDATLESLGLDGRDDLTVEQVCDGAWQATTLTVSLA